MPVEINKLQVTPALSYSKIKDAKQKDKNKSWVHFEREEHGQREPNAPGSKRTGGGRDQKVI